MNQVNVSVACLKAVHVYLICSNIWSFRSGLAGLCDKTLIWCLVPPELTADTAGCWDQVNDSNCFLLVIAKSNVGHLEDGPALLSEALFSLKWWADCIWDLFPNQPLLSGPATRWGQRHGQCVICFSACLVWRGNLPERAGRMRVH